MIFDGDTLNLRGWWPGWIGVAPRFSTMLIPVKYLHKVKTHRPGHHPLNAAFPNGPSPKPITTGVISNAPNLVVSKFRQNQVFD